MEKEYRIEYQKRDGEWTRSGVYTGTFTETEAFAIMCRIANAYVSYRMVHGYAPTTSDVELHDETPVNSVYVLSKAYEFTETGVIGVFTTEALAQQELGKRVLSGVDASFEAPTYIITAFTIDKGV